MVYMGSTITLYSKGCKRENTNMIVMEEMDNEKVEVLNDDSGNGFSFNAWSMWW